MQRDDERGEGMTEGGWERLLPERDGQRRAAVFPMHHQGVSPLGHSGVFYRKTYVRNRSRKILTFGSPACRLAALAHSRNDY